jgi:hypothetical protein
MKTTYAKFQQARCTAKLKESIPILDNLETAFKNNPALRDIIEA